MARARRQPDLFAARPYESDVWTERLLAAFEDASRRTGVLPLAEEALAACPGDPVILLMAATAALLDEKPDRAVVFLKRFHKRASAPVPVSQLTVPHPSRFRQFSLSERLQSACRS